MTDDPRPIPDPDEDQIPAPELDEDAEQEESHELEPHYEAGVDVAVVWSDKAMDHWAWLWRLIDGSKVGVRVLVAGEQDWHASKFSTVNGNRAVPRRAMPLSTNPVDHFRPSDDPCLLTKALPVKSAWRQKAATVLIVVVANVLLASMWLPIESYETKALIGAEHGLLLSLWLCSFYGWRIRGPVSYAKFVLQIRAPWVVTPGGLYREIERRNEQMGM